jgi:uridine kinase
VDLTESLASQFQEGVRQQGRFVVAIDGPGCCGKSSLADKLTALVTDAALLATDDFHLPRGTSPDPDSPLPYRRWKEFMVAATELVDGRPSTFRPINWQSRTLSLEVTVHPAPLLIIEGIAALHPSLASFVDFRIWVDGQASNRMDRVRLRDGDAEVPNWHKYIAFEQKYLETYRPWTTADLWVFGADLGLDNARHSFSRLIDTEGKALRIDV